MKEQNPVKKTTTQLVIDVDLSRDWEGRPIASYRRVSASADTLEETLDLLQERIGKYVEVAAGQRDAIWKKGTWFAVKMSLLALGLGFGLGGTMHIWLGGQ